MCRRIQCRPQKNEVQRVELIDMWNSKITNRK
jgi:hypothetical protein